MLKKLSVKSKVLFALLAVTAITAVTVGFMAVLLGVSTLKEESFKKLTVVREQKANQIETFFKECDFNKKHCRSNKGKYIGRNRKAILERKMISAKAEG